MQKYTYTFAADSAVETVAITAELPRPGDRVYVAGRFMQRLLETAVAGDSPLRSGMSDSLPAWIEFRVCCIDRALDLAGEVVRVVLELSPSKANKTKEFADQTPFEHAEIKHYGDVAVVLGKTPEQLARDAADAMETKPPWDESDGRTVSISASGSTDPVETSAPQAQTTPVLSLQDFADGRGLTITRPSDNHVQLRRAKKVIIEWWPSSGTVRAGNKRLADCADERAFVTLCAKEIE